MWPAGLQPAGNEGGERVPLPPIMHAIARHVVVARLVATIDYLGSDLLLDARQAVDLSCTYPAVADAALVVLDRDTIDRDLFGRFHSIFLCPCKGDSDLLSRPVAANLLAMG